MQANPKEPITSITAQKPSSITIERPNRKSIWRYLLQGTLIATLGFILIFYANQLGIIVLGIGLVAVGYGIIVYGILLFIYRTFKKLRKRLKRH